MRGRGGDVCEGVRRYHTRGRKQIGRSGTSSSIRLGSASRGRRELAAETGQRRGSLEEPGEGVVRCAVRPYKGRRAVGSTLLR